MEEREAITVRFPAGLLAKARELKGAEESLNDLVIQATEHELRYRQGLRAHEEILRIREQVKVRTGVHPDPVPLIRRLREGEEPRV